MTIKQEARAKIAQLFFWGGGGKVELESGVVGEEGLNYG